MKRPMALIGFTFAIILVALESLPDNQKFNALLFSLPIFAATLIIPPLRKNKFFVLFISACVMAVAVSFTNYKLNIEPVEKYANKQAKISCIIDDIPYNKNNNFYYHVKVKSVNGEDVRPFYTVISTSEPLEGDLDDTFFCQVYFYSPQSSYFFDSKHYYRSKKIHIKALLDVQTETRAVSPEIHSLKYYILNLKRKMLSIPKSFFTKEISDVQNGIFLGEKTSIDNSLKITFLKNGAYHLISTSGIHISIIMSLFLWIFKRLKLGYKTSYLLTVLPILLFVSLTGFTESATRAGITCIIYLLGMVLIKSPDSLNSLGLATFLICLFSPCASLSVGLWMGILSVLGIVLFHKNISIFIHSLFSGKLKKYKITCAIISTISLCISVNLLTAPITILYSNMFSFVQFLSNLFTIPLTTLILISSLTLSVLGVMQFPKLILYPIAFISGISTQAITNLLRTFANLPFSYISLDYPFLKLWAGLTLITSAVCLAFFKRPRSIILSVIISINTILCGILSYQVLNYNSDNISFINCNDGMSCIIRKNGKTACINYFGEKNYTNNAEQFLECNNIDEINYFSVPYCEVYPDDFIKNINNNHNFDSFILPDYIGNHTIKNLDSDTIFFNKNISSELWGGNLKIDIFKQNDHAYTKIVIEDIKILIIPNGGNCNDLPDDWKNCNIAAVYGIPINFSQLNSDSIILYGPQKVVYESIDKIPPNIGVYNLAYYTKLDMICKNHNYKIGV